jgi:hypothetical protein
MTLKITVTTETDTGTTVEHHAATPDTVDEIREQLRLAAPHGSTRLITVK